MIVNDTRSLPASQQPEKIFQRQKLTTTIPIVTQQSTGWGESPDNSPLVVKRRLDGNDSTGQSKKRTSLYIGSKQICSIPQIDSIPEQVGIDVLTKSAKSIKGGTLKVEDNNLYLVRGIRAATSWVCITKLQEAKGRRR